MAIKIAKDRKEQYKCWHCNEPVYGFYDKKGKLISDCRNKPCRVKSQSAIIRGWSGMGGLRYTS